MTSTIKANMPVLKTMNEAAALVSPSGEITLSESILNVRTLMIDVNTRSDNAGGSRGVIIIPGGRNFSAHFIPVYCGSEIGYVRIEMAEKTLSFASTSFSTLYVHNIYGTL